MFNSESRWDRHLPNETGEEEIIDVAALFKKGQVRPICFSWQGRKYYIKDITYRWQDKRGGEVLYFFSVSDGANLYQIHFNNQHLHWRLDKVCPLL